MFALSAAPLTFERLTAGCATQLAAAVLKIMDTGSNSARKNVSLFLSNALHFPALLAAFDAQVPYSHLDPSAACDVLRISKRQAGRPLPGRVMHAVSSWVCHLNCSHARSGLAVLSPWFRPFVPLCFG